jgi:hypothetical protein
MARLDQGLSTDPTNAYNWIDKSASSVSASLRDRQIEYQGLPVDFLVMLVDGVATDKPVYDEFGDPLTPDESLIGLTSQVISTKIIPDFKSYYLLLDLLGRGTESELPLECKMKSTDNIPPGSTCKISLRYPPENELREQIFEVLSTTVKHIETVYSKTLNLVPYRGKRTD